MAAKIFVVEHPRDRAREFRRVAGRGQRAGLAVMDDAGHAAFRARDFEMGDVGWVADFNDPVNFLELNRSSTGAQNYGDYNNPRYDALLAQADRERDLVKRGEILKQAEQLVLDDLPVVPLFFGPSSNLVNPDVTGFVDNIQDFHRKRWMCFKNAAERRAGYTPVSR